MKYIKWYQNIIIEISACAYTFHNLFNSDFINSRIYLCKFHRRINTHEQTRAIKNLILKLISYCISSH